MDSSLATNTWDLDTIGDAEATASEIVEFGTAPWTAQNLLQHMLAHPERYEYLTLNMAATRQVYTILDKYNLACQLETQYPDVFSDLGNIAKRYSVYRPAEEAAAVIESIPSQLQPMPKDELDAILEYDRRFIANILRQPDSPTYKLNREDAYILANDAHGCEKAIDHIANFDGLRADQALADYMLRHGGAGIIIQRLHRFEGVVADQKLASALIDEGRGYLIFHYFERFKGLRLDQAAADQFVAHGGARQVFEYREHFTGLKIDADLAHALIAQRQAERVVYNPELFEGVTLDESWIQEIMEHGQAMAVFQGITLGCLSRPKDLLLAQKLSEQGNARFVLGRINEFECSSAAIVCEVLKHNEPDALSMIRNRLDDLTGFDESQQHQVARALGIPFREFPRSGSKAEQACWYADFMYQDMGPGWRKTSLGSLIAQRIHGIRGEDNLHDVSQWLSAFLVPGSGYNDRGYDIATIHALKASHPQMSASELLSAAQVRYQDESLEQDLLRQLYQADPALRARLNLPTNATKLQLMFTETDYRFVYEILATNLKNHHLFDQDITDVYRLERSALWQLIQENFDDFYNQYVNSYTHGELTAQWLPKELLLSRIQGVCLRLSAAPETTLRLSESVSLLQKYGHQRQAYINDATKWLLRHASTPNAHLTKVWKDRARAIAEGINDSAPAIMAWQNEAAFQQAVADSDEAALPNGITKQELTHPLWQPWRKELSRVMGVGDTIQAISLANGWLAEVAGKPKRLPSAQITVGSSSAGSGKPHSFEILNTDDPRGFTIGSDTGCCMTLNGAARSCIEEGYKNSNAGFVALYDPEQTLAAQSFWYINPSHPHILILDNIETNQGRNIGNILEIYTRALQTYLGQHPELGITQVHVGEGYSDVALGHLPPAQPIAQPTAGVYTDAAAQRLLFSMTGNAA